MQRAPRDTHWRPGVRRGEIARSMATALQRFFIEPDACEDALHDRDMHRFAAMTRTHQRELVRAKAVMRKAAVFDERQSLQWL